MTENFKTCTRCRQTKPLDAYTVKRGGKLKSWCRACGSRATMESARKHEDYGHHSQKKLYGLTREGYRKLREDYPVCGICAKTSKRRNLDTDHDHQTGRVRGRLCSRCNTMLGSIEALGSDWARRIRRYLNRTKDYRNVDT